jgi:2-polyprenyl-6-methoxyphenol hydroxylase-like FAD-dependent oxidoreductase
VARSRTVIIAGAGIGGLTCALALIRAGYRVVVLEQAEALEAVGAGIQLAPNATRILIDLGVAETLAPMTVAPREMRVLRGHNAREIVRGTIGADAAFRYGAPYWLVHRGDLHTALLKRLQASHDGALHLGRRVEDFAVHAHGVTVVTRTSAGQRDEHSIALIGADGLWSRVRSRVGDDAPAQFAGRTAWRALVPADLVPLSFREPSVWLWLGPQAHLVHYPVRGGAAINIVAIVQDTWQSREWSEPGTPADILRRFSRWAAEPRALVGIPDAWAKWALFERPALCTWSAGPVTLLGDAAHPALPFLAQGAAMAIEDAAVLANCLARSPEQPAVAFETYEGLRRPRTQRVALESRFNGTVYHLRGPAAVARNLALAALSGERLLRRYDWLYDWRPE